MHLGLSPSAALPLLNRAGSWLIPLLLGWHEDAEKRPSSLVPALGTTEEWQAAAEGQLCLSLPPVFGRPLSPPCP